MDDFFEFIKFYSILFVHYNMKLCFALISENIFKSPLFNIKNVMNSNLKNLNNKPRWNSFILLLKGTVIPSSRKNFNMKCLKKKINF